MKMLPAEIFACLEELHKKSAQTGLIGGERLKGVVLDGLPEAGGLQLLEDFAVAKGYKFRSYNMEGVQLDDVRIFGSDVLMDADDLPVKPNWWPHDGEPVVVVFDRLDKSDEAVGQKLGAMILTGEIGEESKIRKIPKCAWLMCTSDMSEELKKGGKFSAEHGLYWGILGHLYVLELAYPVEEE